jgi:hypothetical protein
MDKAAWKAHLKQEKHNKARKKRLQREKYEKDNCGGYQLIYPLVSYAEEDIISARIEKEEIAMGKKQDRPGSADSGGHAKDGEPIINKEAELRALEYLDNELSDQ